MDDIPSGKLTVCYRKWAIEIVDLPMENGDVSCFSFVCLPGRVHMRMLFKQVYPSTTGHRETSDFTKAITWALTDYLRNIWANVVRCKPRTLRDMDILSIRCAFFFPLLCLSLVGEWVLRDGPTEGFASVASQLIIDIEDITIFSRMGPCCSKHFFFITHTRTYIYIYIYIYRHMYTFSLSLCIWSKWRLPSIFALLSLLISMYYGVLQTWLVACRSHHLPTGSDRRCERSNLSKSLKSGACPDVSTQREFQQQPPW